MHTFPLELLLDSMARAQLTPRENARLTLPDQPEPFVPPTLSTSDLKDPNAPFAAEVILISAPAAVGKSTLAKYISARVGAALLNLATTPVATHSLVGMIQGDFEGGGSALEAFHKAELPLIIDALDEGRLLTGEKGFEQFLLTTAELLLRDRTVINRPKLVVLGRTGSSALAALALAYFGDDLVAKFDIEFFDEPSARRVIECYATALSLGSKDFRSVEPAQRVIDAYFQAIERALSLAPNTLWLDPIGRAFSGYAPVLATLGDVLAREGNFQSLENRLKKTASTHGDAWGVIAEVISQMLVREGAQLRAKFPAGATSEVPVAVYNSVEQLEFLARWLAKVPVRGTGSHPLSGDLAETYYALVEQKLPEHPFVDSEEHQARNAVFAAAVFAHAIAVGVDLAERGNSFFEEAARQPFLWRFFERYIADNTLIDGRFLGYLLASLWSDPLATGSPVTLDEASGASVVVRIETAIPRKFEATTPVSLYGTVRGIRASVPGELILCGASAHGGRAVFSALGRNILKATRLRVASDEFVIDGYAWVEANTVEQGSRFSLQIKPGALYGWAGNLLTTYPWSTYKGTASAGAEPHAGATLVRLIEAFKQHMGATPRPFWVATNYGALDSLEYGERATWMERDFGYELPRFVRALVDHGLASAEAISGQKDRRLKISLKRSWDDLLAAAHDPKKAPQEVRDFVFDVNERMR